ncbi:CE1759 family FMN reductase [Nonomuraea corallina]|uniref:CE1759 family FMN reductase n=1 Tax=Nonomuraea corallina TaxID=2989783 RepID=UPI0038CD6389
MKLVVVTAGLTQPSSTRLLADRLARAAAERLGGASEPVVVELRDLAVEIAGAFVTGFPNARLRAAIDAVTGADGLIAVTPVFTASYSGLFKSFFDVLDPKALAGKPVLIAATGGTPRHSLVLEHAMRPLFAYLRAVVTPTAVYAATEDWGGGGDAYADGLADRIDRAAAELADLMRRTAPAAGRPAAVEAGGAATGETGGPAVSGASSGPAGCRDAGADLDEVVPFQEYLASIRPSR